MRVLDNPYVRSWEGRNDEIQPFPQQAAKSYAEGVLTISEERYEDVDPQRTCLPAGQGSGGIDAILPAGEIVRRVVAEAEEAIGRMGKALV
jgi:enoyl-[acyl-carrier protein] reductase II